MLEYGKMYLCVHSKCFANIVQWGKLNVWKVCEKQSIPKSQIDAYY